MVKEGERRTPASRNCLKVNRYFTGFHFPPRSNTCCSDELSSYVRSPPMESGSPGVVHNLSLIHIEEFRSSLTFLAFLYFGKDFTCGVFETQALFYCRFGHQRILLSPFCAIHAFRLGFPLQGADDSTACQRQNTKTDCSCKNIGVMVYLEKLAAGYSNNIAAKSKSIASVYLVAADQ